ncbi:MAG: TonB family protein [Synechococcales cyanobacterium C42_A2020_086]|nr:TonB family protein [Synechococcales cyanobacterium C42_A2020_086]
MTRLDSTNAAGSDRLSSPSRSWRFWGLLIGGSIAMHWGLLGLVQPLSQRFVLPAPSVAATPIDLIELAEEEQPAAANPPAAAPPSSPSTTKPPATKPPLSAAPAQSTPPDAAGVPTTPAAPSASLGDWGTTPGSIGIAPPSAPNPSPIQSPTAPSPQPPPPSSIETPSVTPSTVSTPSIATPEFGGLPEENRPIAPSPIPTPTPSVSPSPLISTLPIDTPVPDVSGTLPLPSANPSPLPSVVTPQGVVPAQLTARLTAPPPAELPLNTPARPRANEQTFAVDPSTSPCPVTPEAVEFLGTAVTVQVSTDETGTVTDTVTRESSDSPAYDALAQCLVNNWQFEPARAQGIPIADDALVVQIIIERSEAP